MKEQKYKLGNVLNGYYRSVDKKLAKIKETMCRTFHCYQPLSIMMKTVTARHLPTKRKN
jgi:hypothetical protein